MKGIGNAKACVLVAALELARRGVADGEDDGADNLESGRRRTAPGRNIG